jgi:glycosyltransferase involved in cell wall biosynthesis
MAPSFDDARVAVALLYPRPLPYAHAAFTAGVQTVLDQDHGDIELIVVDARGPQAPPDFLPANADPARIQHYPGNYADRAAMLARALEAAGGEFLLMLLTDQAAVQLKRSATLTMLMAALREADQFGAAGLVYADYERILPGGQRQDVHLLDWHPGRLRDSVDFGYALLIHLPAARALGGIDPAYQAAALYDLRLRISEQHRLVHVANRFSGALYSVAAPADAHSVFAYLLDDPATQRDMEHACTAHLRRNGAYLAPGAHIRPVKYTPAELASFTDCLASIIIPVHQRPEFIGPAIASALAQPERQLEGIVVVHGGPTAPTAEAVRRYLPGGDRHDPTAPPVRLIVVDVNNLGLCLNAGLAAARGQYYVQLDSDDRLTPDAVARIIQVFDSDPTIGVVIGSYEVWTLDEHTGQVQRDPRIPVVKHEEWTADNGRNNLLRLNGAGAPRAAHIKVIRELGWFGVNDTPACRNYGEDYDLVLRISERYNVGRVWEPNYRVIRHAGGTDHAIDQATIDRNDNAKDHMRLAALRRRQALNARPEQSP